MYELFTLRRTFNSENEIINSKPDNLDSEDVPELFKTLIIDKMLTKNPIQRINSTELKNTISIYIIYILII